jgi:hypothetical protein
MKPLHRPDLFCWSAFDEARNVDFNGYLWVRPEGNVAVDPMPLSAHDRAHMAALGGCALVVVTNSDHCRGVLDLVAWSGAELAGPLAEREGFPLPATRWLGEGDEVVPGLRVLVMEGSKTPGELALLLEGTTLLTGDLVRAHVADRLNLLPPEKLADRAAAVASVRRLAALPDLDAVLVGDGWPVFRQGGLLLRELAARLG